MTCSCTCLLTSRTGSPCTRLRLAVADVRDDENGWPGGQLVGDIDVHSHDCRVGPKARDLLKRGGGGGERKAKRESGKAGKRRERI